jgi:tetrahydromethanopterin S-methyltransferase subunit B
LSTIIISPDFDIILDAENKVVGEARRDIAILDITPLEKKISELEALVDELVNLLSSKGATALKSRYRGERARLRKLFLKYMAIGFLIGLALFSLSALAYHTLQCSGAIEALANIFRHLT